MFFLYKDVLYCKEKYKGLFIYKIIIPDLISHDLVSQSHRHFNCVKGKKLYNQLSVSFEIRNLKELVNRTVKECFSCNITAPEPCGKYRKDLPKNPTMLKTKMQVWAIGKVQILSRKMGHLH